MILKWGNLALLVLFPLAWIAPLAHAGLLPFFGTSQITVLSGLRTLWQSDVALAVIVAAFALVFPILKTLMLSGVHFRLLTRRALPLLALLGKLSMADMFLIAVYIVLAKGVGVGRVEPGWGLYLFTACVLASILLTFATMRQVRR
ncbi:paraquat-inducible protein A [Oceanomicrobium pacificus]|uniref:Paraquat-inducible membrane protein A n=1 Tax=Oceanomicrobium pacificus TaxID=2692916 RepID=A0A6B0TXA0_9RHOB|nr:paraquat-inducible protein A [Oceanomicrobium pacificus]MXU65653.1 paraquat-inducible membrane protein A [Oceanomicrobium pacificus]